MASTALSGTTISNPYYQYITTTGIIVPDTSEIVAGVQSEWRSAFSDAISVNAATPQGLIISMEALGRKSVLEACSLVANQLNPNTATGIFLDVHGALFACSRFGDTHSNARCLVTGVPGIEENGQVYVYFYANDPGAISATNLNYISTPVVGWETVSTVNAVTGAVTESDAEYRKRIADSRYTGLAMIPSIRAKLNAVDGIQGYALYENFTGGTKTIQNEDGTNSNVTLPAHSICLIVKDASNSEAIAKALYTSKPCGCDYTSLSGHSVSVVVIDRGGTREVPYTITFNRAEAVTLDVEISVKTNKYAGDDLYAKIKAAIQTWQENGVPEVEGISIGTAVSPFEISNGVSAQLPEIIVNYVKAAEHGQTLGYAPVAIDAGAIAAIPQENIVVVIDGNTVTQ